MPAPLSLRIKERYMAKRASGLSQQLAADAVGISLRSGQRIDRGELQANAQQQQCGRRWRTRADPLAEVWDSLLVPMLEKAPQLEPQTLLLHLEQSFPDQEWYRRKRTLQRRVEQWKAGPIRSLRKNRLNSPVFPPMSLIVLCSGWISAVQRLLPADFISSCPLGLSGDRRLATPLDNRLFMPPPAKA